jgi:hypothetical protein
MAAFSKLDWQRFDVWAIVAMGGISVVDLKHQQSCHAWLQRNDYTVNSIDFGKGIGPAVSAFSTLFHWQEQFGYELDSGSRNLDALRDGFHFSIKPGQGHMLELVNAEVAYQEDKQWFCGLLGIAHEYSRRQLALGAKFFIALMLDHDSKLIGMEYHVESIPVAFWTAKKDAAPFDI